MSRKTNLRRLSVLVTAQTLHNLERLAAMDGSRNLGRVVDKLTRDKMVSMWWKGELTDDAGRRGRDPGDSQEDVSWEIGNQGRIYAGPRRPPAQQRAADAGGTAEDGWGASLHDFPLRHWESRRSLGISWDAKMGCCIADLWLRMVKL